MRENWQLCPGDQELRGGGIINLQLVQIDGVRLFAAPPIRVTCPDCGSSLTAAPPSLLGKHRVWCCSMLDKRTRWQVTRRLIVSLSFNCFALWDALVTSSPFVAIFSNLYFHCLNRDGGAWVYFFLCVSSWLTSTSANSLCLQPDTLCSRSETLPFGGEFETQAGWSICSITLKCSPWDACV